TGGVALGSGAGIAPWSEERDLPLGVSGFRYGDLYDPARLEALDACFRAELGGGEPALSERFEAYRSGSALTPPEESALLIDVARPLGAFVARLFRVEAER